MKLAIPDPEIRDIFGTQIMEFFKENVKKDGETYFHVQEDSENEGKDISGYLYRSGLAA